MFPWDSDSFPRVSFRLSILGGCVLTEQRAHARLMNQVVALRNHNHSWVGRAQRPALGAHVSPPDGNQIWLKSFRNCQLAVPEMEPPLGSKASFRPSVQDRVLRLEAETSQIAPSSKPERMRAVRVAPRRSAALRGAPGAMAFVHASAGFWGI